MAIVPEAAGACQDGKTTLQATGLNHIALDAAD